MEEYHEPWEGYWPMLHSMLKDARSAWCDGGAGAAVLVAALTTLLLTGCQEDVPTASEDVPAGDGPAAATSHTPVHHVLVRQVAAALADDPDLRKKVAEDMKGSPVHEGKLFLADYLRNEGSRLLKTAAQEGEALAPVADADGGVESPGGRLTVEQRADSILAMVDRVAGGAEMYMPVDDHREAWDGGSDLIVATMVGEDRTAEPYGVNLAGQEVDLKRDSPPTVPTLVVVPAEGFTSEGEPRKRALKLSALKEAGDCLAYCGGGGGGGGGVYCPSGSTGGGDRGVGIQETALCWMANNFHEPWPSGNPEFYILLAGTSDSDPADELNKKINIPDHIWDNVDEGDFATHTQAIAFWTKSWGERVRVQCFESDADIVPDGFTLSGNTTATIEGDIGPASTSISFSGDFDVGNASDDEDDDCGTDYIPLRAPSTGEWTEIPAGPEGNSGNLFDGPSDLKWFGEGEDITV